MPCWATLFLLHVGIVCPVGRKSPLVSGDATSGASSRLAMQGGAVAAWLHGCLVVATWPRVEDIDALLGAESWCRGTLLLAHEVVLLCKGAL